MKYLNPSPKNQTFYFLAVNSWFLKKLNLFLWFTFFFKMLSTFCLSKFSHLFMSK